MNGRRRAARTILIACACALLVWAVAPDARAQCADPCTDHNVCTVNDHCSNDYCRGAALPNGTPCDDGDPSTVGDICTAGICEGVLDDGGARDGSSDAADDGAAATVDEQSASSGDDAGCSVGRAGAHGDHGALAASLLALAAWVTRRTTHRA